MEQVQLMVCESSIVVKTVLSPASVCFKTKHIVQTLVTQYSRH